MVPHLIQLGDAIEGFCSIFCKQVEITLVLYERFQIVVLVFRFYFSFSHFRVSKLDDFWLKMRISDIDTPASYLLVKGQIKEVFKSSAPTLSDSLVTYCSLKGQDRAKMFFTAAHRNVGYVIDHLGDRPIDTYSTLDAASFRDWLVERDLSPSSISGIFPLSGQS